jgi:hypothetical protein
LNLNTDNPQLNSLVPAISASYANLGIGHRSALLVGVSQISKYRDRAWRASLKVVSYFVFFAGIDLSHAQAGSAHAELSRKPILSSTDATLSVSLTVAGSITVLFDPNGNQTLVVANAPPLEMKEMLAAFEARKTPHRGKELHSRKRTLRCLAKVQTTGKEQ